MQHKVIQGKLVWLKDKLFVSSETVVTNEFAKWN